MWCVCISLKEWCVATLIYSPVVKSLCNCIFQRLVKLVILCCIVFLSKPFKEHQHTFDLDFQSHNQSFMFVFMYLFYCWPGNTWSLSNAVTRHKLPQIWSITSIKMLVFKVRTTNLTALQHYFLVNSNLTLLSPTLLCHPPVLAYYISQHVN